jgi:PPK2 family polyphosphate:nucleotide phosphotransferase
MGRLFAEDFVERHRVTKGKGFRLADCDPGDTGHLDRADKEKSQELLREGIARLADLQAKLYAQDRWAVLLIFQAMDAAGKDSVIKHVFSGLNPSGCEVQSFKQPSSEELDHDFLWRTTVRLPERGHLGIFNRSYYEEVLIVRVHPQILAAQKLPPELVGKKIWEHRYEDIRAHERMLARNGTVVRKFFLNVSKEEQRQRFLERLDEPNKNWKFALGDVKERAHWGAYREAYEETIRETATEAAPWYVVPADNKWYTRLVVAAAVVDALEELELEYPTVDAPRKKDLAAARRLLVGEKRKK